MFWPVDALVVVVAWCAVFQLVAGFLVVSVSLFFEKPVIPLVLIELFVIRSSDWVVVFTHAFFRRWGGINMLSCRRFFKAAVSCSRHEEIKA